jgi:acetyl esterase/lipase
MTTKAPVLRAVPVAVLTALAVASAGAHAEEAPAVPDGVAFRPDLTYRKAGNTELQLDLAYPRDGDGKLPTVIVLHGTGVLNKGRKYYVPLVLELARRGYVGAAVSYRYKASHPFPTALEDAQEAVRWLRANGDRYRIDGDRVGALGFSGGGSLACFLGMESLPEELKGRGGPAKHAGKVRAVVSYFAPTDLTRLHATAAERVKGAADPARTLKALYVRTTLEAWLGGPPLRFPELYARASPINYVTKGAAPLLLIHGDADAVVPVEQSRVLARKVKEAGGVARLLVMEKAPHDFDELNDANARKAAAAARAFLDEHLKAGK